MAFMNAIAGAASLLGKAQPLYTPDAVLQWVKRPDRRRRYDFAQEVAGSIPAALTNDINSLSAIRTLFATSARAPVSIR
jgi:hypothetical protein